METQHYNLYRPSAHSGPLNSEPTTVDHMVRHTVLGSDRLARYTHPVIDTLLPSGLGGARRVNAATVLSLIRSRGPLSRTDVIAECRLSKATVSGLVAELISYGLVVETGTVAQPRGRSRIMLEFNPAAAHVIGVQISDDHIYVVTTDLAGVIVTSTTVASRPGTAEDVIALIAAEVNRQASNTPLILGIGVGAPGVVEPPGRVIRIALSHGWHDVAFADQLESLTDLPVVVTNRAQTVALAHMVIREDGRSATLAHAFLGDGVVAGVAIDGRIHSGGAHGRAGEIGHVTVDPTGPECPSCGGRGCLTSLAGRQRLLDELGMSWPQVVTRTRAGDPVTLEVVSRAGRWIGRSLASIAAVLDPDVIVLSGPTTELGAPLLEAIEEQLRASAPATEPAPVSVVAEDGAQGAALFWLQRALNPR